MTYDEAKQAARQAARELASAVADEIVIISELSQRAQRQHTAALWYAWGREDAGNRELRDHPEHRGRCLALTFAEYAALEAERFETGRTHSLSPVQDQYLHFLRSLSS